MQEFIDSEERRKPGRPMGSEDRGERLTRARLSKRLQTLERLGVLQGTSRRVLEAMGGDAYWLTVFDRLEDESNWEKIAQLMMFHQQMRDGRPAQQITVTSIGITFSPEEIARARGVVRELVKSGPSLQLPANATVDAIASDNGTNPPCANERSETIAESDATPEAGESKAKHALPGARG